MSYQPIGIEYGTFNNNRLPMVNLYCTDKFYQFINCSHDSIKFRNGITITCTLFDNQLKMAVLYNYRIIFNIDNGGFYDFIKNVRPKIFIMIIEFLVEKGYITINFDE